MISTDRKIFEAGSAVYRRMIEYGALFDELHVVVSMKREFGVKAEHIAPNVWFYPTNSLFKIFYPFGAYRTARRIIKSRHFEKTHAVITSQDPFETGLAALAVSRRSKLPLQVQVHTDFLNPNFIDSSLLNQIRLHIAAYVLPRAHAVRTVTEKIKKDLVALMKLAAERITVLPIFVDAKMIIAEKPVFDLRRKYPQFKFIILMASRLTAEKNISFALEVFRRVLDKYPFTGLVIVGSGPEEKNLKQRAKELSVENNVVFEPWQRNLVSYYKTASMFLSVSRFEGYGLTLIEAALSGCPIVTASVGIAETWQDGREARVCRTDDPGVFAAAIFSLMEDNEKRHMMRIFAREHLENELPSKRKYLALYKKSLEDTLALSRKNS